MEEGSVEVEIMGWFEPSVREDVKYRRQGEKTLRKRRRKRKRMVGIERPSRDCGRVVVSHWSVGTCSTDNEVVFETEREE